ncbi:MAG: YaaA family protein [Candidatus Gracilibacteria bacterium]|nr:YaaA family protein [Candidatus Gracilibacteria bacterium]
MKIIYLLPPSEGKNPINLFEKEELTYNFKKPYEISINATQKDLKCIGDRFEEGINLNKNILNSMTNYALNRYDGVMFKAIDYENMNGVAREYFEENFLFLSGMYGILKPKDKIGNYKLPIETKGLSKYWTTEITNTLNNLKADVIIDFLPNSYKKMIDKKSLNKKLIEVDFLTQKNGKIQKISHGVKKIKGEFIKEICENNGFNFDEKLDKIEIFK